MRKYFSKLGLQIDIDKLPAIGIGVGCGVNDFVNNIELSMGAGIWIWVSFEHSWLKRLYKKFPDFEYCFDKENINYMGSGGRGTGIVMWSDHISAEWNCYRMDGRTGNWSFFHWEWLFGMKERISSRVVTEFPVIIEMPERNYSAQLTQYYEVWKRKRLPWKDVCQRAEFIMHEDESIPIPGKGESGYDLDDTSIYNMSILMDTKYPNWLAAVVKFKEIVLERRLKYGGRNWHPTKEYSDFNPVHVNHRCTEGLLSVKGCLHGR